MAWFSVLLPIISSAQQVWTVETIPNTRLQGNDIHVSDPDDLLSDSCEMRINTALCSIQDKADVFVVALTSIGDADEAKFANELFNLWGIGDAQTNNGVLMLFAEQQRILKFETGYGAEATLTDVRCQEIFTKSIVPYFKQGDYEGGLCSGIAEIVNVFGGTIPDGLVSKIEDPGEDQGSGLTWASGILALLMLVLPIVASLALISNSGERTAGYNTLDLEKTIDDVPYYSEMLLKWSGNAWERKGCFRALLFGFSLLLFMFVAFFVAFMILSESEGIRFDALLLVLSVFLYLTYVCLRHNTKTLKFAKKLAMTSCTPKAVYQSAYDYSLTKTTLFLAPWIAWIFRRKYKKMLERSSDFCCPECHAAMSDDTGYSLPKAQQLESKLKVFSYRPLRCGNGHVMVMSKAGYNYGVYSVCSDCGAQAVKVFSSKTIMKATSTTKGLVQKDCECQFCGKKSTIEEEIPMHKSYSGYSGGGSYSSSSSSSYHGSSSGSSHSSSSGSFGGGRSGGGGYTGRW